MRLCMELRNVAGNVPQHYNYYLQSLFYRLMPPLISTSIHEQGFEQGPRRFKLFTFSKLMGDFSREGSFLKFKSEVSLCFSSPLDQVVASISKTLMDNPYLRIGKAEFHVENVKMKLGPVEGKDFYTLSPVTVYKHVGDGVRYLSPYEPEFQHLVSLNAERKLLTLREKKPTTPLKVTPLEVYFTKVIYKGNVVTAWRGKFRIMGPSSLIKVVYEAGLGSKNSQGFGMIEAEGVKIR